MNDTPAPNPRRSLPWLAWGLINIVSLVVPWALLGSREILPLFLVIFGFAAFAAGNIDGRPRILALLTLSGWAVLIPSLSKISADLSLLFFVIGPAALIPEVLAMFFGTLYPAVLAVFFGMGIALKATPHHHKPDTDLERLLVDILWVAVITSPFLLVRFVGDGLPHPGEYAAILFGVVAVYFGLKKGLVWVTSDPPSKSEMELEAILKTIQGGECQVVEFNDDADLEKVGEAVASFANTVGGILILGVSDDGKIVGVQEDSETLTARMTSFIQNGLSAPVWACRLGHTILPEGRIHWIEVSRQLGEPLRYNGTVYVRHGRSNVEPGPLELAELYNMFEYNLTPKPTV